MTCFYEANSVLQTIILVISQFVVISLAFSVVFLFRRKCKFGKQGLNFALFWVNVSLYLVLQLDARLTGAERGMHFHIPYFAVLVFLGVSLLTVVYILLGETKNRKTISNTSIKEAFDNLPTGVCFFNEAGLPVLCNHAMYRFCFAFCGKDLQVASDLESCFEGVEPTKDGEEEGRVLLLEDGTAWRVVKRSFTYDNVEVYTQYTATDVTSLNKSRIELTKGNEQLRMVQENLKRLAINVIAITREEEVFNAKMKVHDELGRCLIAAQQCLRSGNFDNVSESLVSPWQKAVSTLKTNNVNDSDMLLQIRKTCKFFNAELVQKGEIPQNESVAYLLICAVRECVTNAVKYAGATKIYADFYESDTEFGVVITNNGNPPQKEISEGGGLSTLRKRVEHAGGIMTVESVPMFKLKVRLGKRDQAMDN